MPRLTLAGAAACTSLALAACEVAVTAWRNFAGCDSFDQSVLDVVGDFRDEFLGKSPEPVPL